MKVYNLKIDGFYLNAAGRFSLKDKSLMKFNHPQQALDYARENFPKSFSEGRFLVVNKNGGF